MRMLIADDDAAFRQFVRSIVEPVLGYDIVEAETGAAALKLALTPPIPDVLLLDWVMPELTGTQVCKLVRASSLIKQPYIAFATSRVRTEEVLAALSAGADDLLPKPVAPDVLLVRLSVPQHRRPSQNPRRIWNEIVAACKRGSGELAVTSGGLTARVLVHDGKIAWAHLADASDNLFDALDPSGGINSETAQAILDECRTTGASLSDTLIAWGLADRARVREALRGWITRKLTAICALPDASSLFLPGNRVFSGDVLFEATDVAPSGCDDAGVPPSRPSQTPTVIPSRSWDAAFTSGVDQHLDSETLLSRCAAVQGVLGVAVLNRRTGMSLGRRGVELNPDIVWALINCLNAAERGGTVQEGIVTTNTRFHFATLMPTHPESFVYALVDSTENLAAARFGLRRVLERIE